MSNSIWFRRGLRVVSWGCLAAAVGLLGSVVLMATGGGVWAYIFYADTPLENLAQGLVCLLLWQLLRRDMESLKAWPKTLARTVLMVISAGFAFFVGEFFLRAMLYSRQQANSLEAMKGGRRATVSTAIQASNSPLGAIVEPSSYPGQQYALQPGLALEFGNTWVQINGDGMRESRDYAVEKGSNVVRIIGIGDSGMFGWGVTQGQDYMSVLENRLNARGDGNVYDVLNLATPGYNTALEVISLKAKGLKYKPDVVVVGWCDNDWFLPYFLLEKENYMRKDVSFLHALLFNRTRFVQLSGGGLMDPRAEGSVEGTTFTDEKGRTSVLRALLELKQLAAENGFEVLVVGPMKDEILRILQDVGLPTYNTYERIPVGSVPDEWEVHFMHPRVAGHQLIGERLADELAARGWIGASAAASEPSTR